MLFDEDEFIQHHANEINLPPDKEVDLSPDEGDSSIQENSKDEGPHEECPSEEQPRRSTLNREPPERHRIITGEWWKEANVATSSADENNLPTTLEEALNSSGAVDGSS